jgi:hypothetical protein
MNAGDLLIVYSFYALWSAHATVHFSPQTIYFWAVNINMIYNTGSGATIITGGLSLHF